MQIVNVDREWLCDRAGHNQLIIRPNCRDSKIRPDVCVLRGSHKMPKRRWRRLGVEWLGLDYYEIGFMPITVTALLQFRAIVYHA